MKQCFSSYRNTTVRLLWANLSLSVTTQVQKQNRAPGTRNCASSNYQVLTRYNVSLVWSGRTGARLCTGPFWVSRNVVAMCQEIWLLSRELLRSSLAWFPASNPTKQRLLLNSWAPSLWSVDGRVRSAAREVNPYRADNRWSASQGMEHQDDQTSYPFEKYPPLLPHPSANEARSKKWLVVGPPLQLFEIGE